MSRDPAWPIQFKYIPARSGWARPMTLSVFRPDPSRRMTIGETPMRHGFYTSRPTILRRAVDLRGRPIVNPVCYPVLQRRTCSQFCVSYLLHNLKKKYLQKSGMETRSKSEETYIRFLFRLCSHSRIQSRATIEIALFGHLVFFQRTWAPSLNKIGLYFHACFGSVCVCITCRP